MTIQEYIKAKADLEVKLINVLDKEIDIFEKSTGLTVHTIEAVLFNKEFDTPKRPRVSDVNIMTELSEGGSK